ncbi:MAG: tRNA (adenosine(37)-N6)-dimethylallyltransferase MiaA [Chloroflexota bacterium]
MHSIVAIVGPTAVGKTELSLRLGALLSLEIVNADSRQVYRYMDIGTGKPTLDERKQVRHHVIDIVDPDDDFSLATYTAHACEALHEIDALSKLPLLVGGTGQYVWSVLEGWDVPRVPPDADFRALMESQARAHGAAALHGELRRIDPVAADRIQAHNLRRVIRALELHRATGELPSHVLWRRRGVPVDALIIGLSMDRDTLIARADSRIDRMIREGFSREVRWLLDMGYDERLPAMSSIGYREMIEYVKGTISLEEAVAGIRRETRRLIRRQRAWFRETDPRIHWLDYAEPDKALRQAASLVEGAAR